MKVGMVVPGGVDRSGTHRVIPTLLALIERIARVHELHVFALRQEPRPAEWELLGARVHNAGGRAPRARALGQLLREHRRAPFDVLHALWWASGTVACSAGRLLGVPVHLHLVGGDLAAVPEIGYGMLGTRRGRLRVRATAALAARVTASSSYTVRRAREIGVGAGRLPLGVSLQDWPPLAPRRRDPDRPARLLFVASLNRVKDPWTAIRAMAILRSRGVAFRLDVIGADTLGGEVQRLAADLDLTEVVHFHGFMTQAEMRPWMEAADVLLVTSLHECGPLVAMEAAIAGVPTVGTAVGHLADWPPDAAVSVPFRDPETVADTVAALLADEDRRLAVAAAAQGRSMEDDADATARRVLEIQDLLTAPANGR